MKFWRPMNQRFCTKPWENQCAGSPYKRFCVDWYYKRPGQDLQRTQPQYQMCDRFYLAPWKNRKLSTLCS